MPSPSQRMIDSISVDAFMARIASNVGASTSSPGDVDLANITQLFENELHESPGHEAHVDAEATAWILAMILRYCDDINVPQTPDVFGKAVAGFSRVFAHVQNVSGFPFEQQLYGGTAVAWACWTSWCISSGNTDRARHVLAIRSRAPSSPLVRAMVLSHVPCQALGFDELSALIAGAIQLFDESRTPESYYASYYMRQITRRCIALAAEAKISQSDQLRVLTALGDTARIHPSDAKDEFILATTAGITRRGTRLLSHEASVQVLRVLSASSQRFRDAYRLLFQALMGVYVAMPAYADVLLDCWVVGGASDFDDQIVLSVLLPACHALNAPTIKSKLAPRCLELLQASNQGKNKLLPLLCDVFCGIFTAPNLSMDDVFGIAIAYIDAYPADDPSISLGVSTLCTVLDGDCRRAMLDQVLDRSRDEHGDGAFRALVDVLGVVHLEDVAGVCARLVMAVSSTRTPSKRRQRVAVLKDFVVRCSDVTRKDYLVAWYSDFIQ